MNSYRSSIGIKIFREEGCVSYLVYDPGSMKAALIDPNLALMDEYRAYLGSHPLKLLYALDTRTHADHFSATAEFKSEFGSEIGMSERTRCQRMTLKLRHGDRIQVGALTFEALETPGSTRDSMCYFVSRKPAALLFTGDTLMIGSSGRTDFPEADPKQLWESIHEKLGKLPGNSLVMPGHEYNNYIFSTIDNEKIKNPHWLIPTQEEFVALKNAEVAELGPNSDQNNMIRRHLEYNRAEKPNRPSLLSGPPGIVSGSSLPRETGGVVKMKVQKYLNKIEETAPGSAFIDVREPEEFSTGHIPKTMNIPLSELGLALTELSQCQRVYVSCASGGRSMMAAKTLDYVGLPNVTNIEGGFRAWVASGLPVEK